MKNVSKVGDAFKDSFKVFAFARLQVTWPLEEAILRALLDEGHYSLVSDDLGVRVTLPLLQPHRLRVGSAAAHGGGLGGNSINF